VVGLLWTVPLVDFLGEPNTKYCLRVPCGVTASLMVDRQIRVWCLFGNWCGDFHTRGSDFEF
jgi:hypothetical protein